jgi:adenylosuccinate synthase
MVQGGTEAVLTNLDVLGYLNEIPVCVAYEIDGEKTEQFPTTPGLIRAKPVYATLPGWKSDIRTVRQYDQLPENCKRYVAYLEKQIGVPIRMVSNGPRREEILYRRA